MDAHAHLAHFYRYLWEDADLLIVIGDGSKIVQGMRAYHARYTIAPPDAVTEAELGRLFVSAGLAAVSLAERESWGWSLNTPEVGRGFFCAVEPEGMVCGQPVDGAGGSVALVQRQKTGEALTQSHFPITATDPVQAVQGYFDESAQELVRVGVLPDLRGALVKALPGGRFSEVSPPLALDDMVERCFRMAGEDGRLKPLGEVLLFYMCRCTEEMILNMLLGLPRDQRDGLWDEQGRLSAECPRCGRSYTITRQ